ncbi:MAG: hypothetical protein R6X02_30870 [Enhygromyxa sp.]
MLAALLIPLFACPPTSIPADGHEGSPIGLASPYGVPHELEPPLPAPRSLPLPNSMLPLWDLEESLAEVEAQLALDDPPAWAPWLAWVLGEASGRDDALEALHDALASPELSAEQLAWWRSVTPDPTFQLRMALERSEHERPRALLTATLALTEYERSCPVPEDVDGACRAPRTDLLLRRHAVALESARQWTELARAARTKLELDGFDPTVMDPATRALWAELELAAATADYEALLDAQLPADLSFVVEEWRRDSGVRAWEAEYARQVVRARESRARAGAWFASTFACARAQLDLYEELLRVDARSSGVALLRSARTLIAVAEALDVAGEWGAIRMHGKDAVQRGGQVGTRQTDVIYEQAREYLALCLEHSRASLDGPIEAACVATLARLGSDLRPLIEFTGEPKATSRVQGHGVRGPADWGLG